MKIIQCWDDGIIDDARLTEILRRHGAKATFNLNFSTFRPDRYCGWRYKDKKDVWRLGLSELKDVYEGFDIANHTFAHKRPTQISDAELQEEVVRGKESLEQFFGRAIRGFAYPFGDYNEKVKDAVRQTGHAYARTVKNTDRVWPPADPMEFHSSCHFLSPEFWTCYERAKANDGVFYFWGHSYELVDETMWQNFEQAIKRISADPEAEWCNIIDLFPAS